MVKTILISMCITSIAWTNNYERNCMACHELFPVSMQEIFMEYLAVYGGEKNLKAGLKHYLQYPSKHLTVMSSLFIDIYEIKEKTILSPKEIDEALDIYWERYKVFGRLY